MIPITLTTFNRPDLLRQMIGSFNRTRWPEGRDYHLFIHDDGSSGWDYDDVVRDIAIPFSVRRENRIGMLWQNLWAISFAMDHAEEYVIKIESDALFHPDWLVELTFLYESLSVSHQIAQASAFTWAKYHPFEEGPGFRRLRVAGGVACILDCEFWANHRIGERTAIMARRDEHAGGDVTSWPHWITKAADASGAWIVATKPSYVQHMGVGAAHSSPTSPEAAATDFVGVESIEA